MITLSFTISYSEEEYVSVFFCINEELQIEGCLGGHSEVVAGDGVKVLLLLHTHQYGTL